MKRRNFLQAAVAFAVSMATLPSMLWARPKEAFAATSPSDVVTNLYPGKTVTVSDKIKLKAPAIAENGAVVPITVSTDLANVTNISVLVDENPNPLAVAFDLTPDAVANVSIRLKMGKTSNVTALVATSDGLFSATQEVKVTIGGCGG